MMYKIVKYKNADKLDTVKGLQSDIRSLEKQLKAEEKKGNDFYLTIRKIEWHLKKKTGLKIHLEDIAELVGWK